MSFIDFTNKSYLACVVSLPEFSLYAAVVAFLGIIVGGGFEPTIFFKRANPGLFFFIFVFFELQLTDMHN